MHKALLPGDGLRLTVWRQQTAACPLLHPHKLSARLLALSPLYANLVIGVVTEVHAHVHALTVRDVVVFAHRHRQGYRGARGWGGGRGGRRTTATMRSLEGVWSVWGCGWCRVGSCSEGVWGAADQQALCMRGGGWRKKAPQGRACYCGAYLQVFSSRSSVALWGAATTE